MPLVWLGRLNGFRIERRVYGPELMLAACEAGVQDGLRHFFYGAMPSTLDSLVGALARRFPGLQIAGSIAPPYRELTAAEDSEFVAQINAARRPSASARQQEGWTFRTTMMMFR